MGGCGRTVVLRAEHHGTLRACRRVRRSDGSRCQARRFAYRAADEVRDGGESENRQGDWHRTSDRDPATRRPGDRMIAAMKRRDFITLLGEGRNERCPRVPIPQTPDRWLPSAVEKSPPALSYSPRRGPVLALCRRQ